MPLTSKEKLAIVDFISYWSTKPIFEDNVIEYDEEKWKEVAEFLKTTIFWFIATCVFFRKSAKLQDKLDTLASKSQAEQDLSLATTHQLMNEVQTRMPGFILLMPVATNKQNEAGLSMYIKGIPGPTAIGMMTFACKVISSGQMREGTQEFDGFDPDFEE